MTENTQIKIFEEKKVRTLWDKEKEEWYFSVVDVVAVLTESKDATAYWRKLKQRLKAEGNETVTNCHGLKMQEMVLDWKQIQKLLCCWKTRKKIFEIYCQTDSILLRKI